jgi:hypothetical protein
VVSAEAPFIHPAHSEYIAALPGRVEKAIAFGGRILSTLGAVKVEAWAFENTNDPLLTVSALCVAFVLGRIGLMATDRLAKSERRKAEAHLGVSHQADPPPLQGRMAAILGPNFARDVTLFAILVLYAAFPGCKCTNQTTT